MIDPTAFMHAFATELERLGLRYQDIPGLAVSTERMDELLAHVRALQLGATWRDVVPELPEDWEQRWGESANGEPDARPYRPLGPYDYQEPPASSAFLIHWATAERPADYFEQLVADARAAGFSVHGAGATIRAQNARALAQAAVQPEMPRLDAAGFIVLSRGTSEADELRFDDWLMVRPDVEHANWYRLGHTRTP